MDPETTICTGRVRGRRIDVDGQATVLRFTGVPYAQPTAGAARFRPPRPAAGWTGVRDATELGPSAPQLIRPGRGDDIGPMGEDCLVANVWTPGLTGSRPVLFWIHGGGFGQGAGHSAVTDGARLAAHEDVVVVSVNHRLGLTGYLDLEQVVGDAYAGSGLAGMLDLVQALRWVRENIAAFGGDPRRVLAFGHSGGGGKVATLLAMPAARGLFRSAVIHGGPPFGYREPDAAADTAERLLAALELSPAAADRLAEVPLDRLLAAQESLGVGRFPGVNGMLFAPVVGRPDLPARPEDALATGAGNGVTLMAGTAVDEADYALFAHPEWQDPDFDIDADDLHQRIADTIETPSAAAGLIAAYREAGPARNIDLLREIAGDQFLVRTRRLVDAKIAGDGEPAYLYSCDVNHGQPIGAFHGIQMPFFFDTVAQAAERMPLEATADRLALARVVSHAQVSLAATGTPELPDLDWAPYGARSRAQYVFGDSGQAVVADPDRARLSRWQGVVATSRVDPWARLFA